MLANISENLIKQFLLEQAVANEDIQTLREQEYIETEYEKYKSGKIEIDSNTFLKWLEEKQENSKLFGRFLLENGILQTRDYATEITSDNSISCTKNILLPLRRTLILSPAGEGYTSNYTVPTQRGILIINGAYLNQQAHMMKVHHSTTFVAGFIEGNDQKYNELLIDYYERLKATFHILKPFSTFDLEPKVKFIEKGTVHVLIRDKDEEQLKVLAKRVHGYKYETPYSKVSER